MILCKLFFHVGTRTSGRVIQYTRADDQALYNFLFMLFVNRVYREMFEHGVYKLFTENIDFFAS